MPSPIAHSLMGICLAHAAARPGRRIRTLEAAWLIVCANLPDLDFVPGILTGDAFQYHRGASHSIGFVIAVSVAVYATLRFLRHRRAMRWSILTAIGVFSHLVLDYLTDGVAIRSGVPMFWPLSSSYLVSPETIFGGLRRGSWDAILSWHNIFALAREVGFMAMLIAVVAAARKSPTAARHLRSRLSLWRKRNAVTEPVSISTDVVREG